MQVVFRQPGQVKLPNCPEVWICYHVASEYESKDQTHVWQSQRDTANTFRPIETKPLVGSRNQKRCRRDRLFQWLMNEHDFDYTLNTYAGGSYIQHNRAIPPEISGLVGYVKTLTKRFPDYSYDVKRIIASGDFVVLHSHATLKASHRGNEKKGFIVTDTFRLEDGHLREHWDALQAIDFFTRLLMLLTEGTIGNNNPTF
ncbi:MAG: nuclear transport factor 2 family protein [Cognatishimia sp.]|uniref:nuclear transport factor 2 family protein n=1 Tax=Cognatishimia sp. TaxID=2211648 RepID=UPI004059F7B7